MSAEAKQLQRHGVHLGELDGEPPYMVHGVALGAGDVTHGSSGIEKLWPAEELRKSAETLEGKPLVVDHENTSRATEGKVTAAKYKDDVGVIYEAELYDEELAEKVSNGLLEVSIRGFHKSVDELDETDDGVKIVEDIAFDNLSIVPNGASQSNTIKVGEHDDLTAMELAQEFVEETTEDEASEEEAESDDVSDEIIDFTELTEWTDEELAQHEVREPIYDGGTESDWEKPSLNDFTDASWDDLSSDEKSDIAAHFLLSKTGFPPENFEDLALPVVEPNGDLNLSALQNAKARAEQVEGISDDEERVVDIINSLANGEFDREWGMEDDEMEASEDSDGQDETELNEQDTTMTEDIEDRFDELESKIEELSSDDEAEEVEDDASDELAEKVEGIESTLDELRERTDELDEVEQSAFEDLKEADDPIVLEQARFDELADEVDDVKTEYAEELSEHIDVLDTEELKENYSVGELSEKVEELDIEDEETDEVEEAEEASEDADESPAELADEEPAPKSADDADEGALEREVEGADDVEEALDRVGWSDDVSEETLSELEGE